MQADSFFSIGESHTVCEDYALHGEVNERSFAVLSDGCSSSEYTDFGSRFLCLATQEAMEISSPIGFQQDAVLPLACALVGKALPWSCLDATVIVLYHSPSLLVAQMVGDGVTVARHRDGTFYVREVEFSNNAPGYLTYRLDNQRYRVYQKGIGETPGGIRTITETRWESSFQEMLEEPKVYEEGLVSSDTDTFWNYVSYNRYDFDLLMAFSDGVLSFQCKTSLGNVINVPLPQVLRELLQFKGMKGKFVERRCKSFFKRFCVSKQWTHYDDFSLVALYDDNHKEV